MAFWTSQENTVFKNKSLIEGYCASSEDYNMEDTKFCSQEELKLRILILGMGDEHLRN